MTQWEHKSQRGYPPVEIVSAYWIGRRGLADAVGRFLKAERAAMRADIAALSGHSPFRQT